MLSRVLKPPFSVETEPLKVGLSASELAATHVATEVQVAAESILLRTREEALAILEQAEAEAATVRETARNEGWHEGYRAGQEEVRAELNALVEGLRQALERPLAEVAVLNRRVDLAADAVVLGTAALLAEQVLGEALADRDRLLRRARALLDETDGDRLRLYCAPEVLEWLKQAEPALERGRRTVEILQDEHLNGPDLVVSGAEGGLDGRLTETLAHILEEVLQHGSGTVAESHPGR